MSRLMSDAMLSARVVAHDHHRYAVRTVDGRRFTARVSGAFDYRVAGPSDYPTIGDYVLIAPVLPEGAAGATDSAAEAVIQQVEPRAAAIARKRVGEATEAQVIAAHVDVALLVFGLDGGRAFTEGLLSRLLATVRAGGVQPVVVLNKCDCATAEVIERTVNEVNRTAPGVAVCVLSARTGAGIELLRRQWKPQQTVCLIGSSGVGKSSLLNALAGSALEPVGETRADHRGRHTTSRKRLYELADGTSVIDLPGIRELQLWSDDSAVAEVFDDIAELALECRFRDCSHTGEPGCAVQRALYEGSLAAARYERYIELRRETAWLERRVDQRARDQERRRWINISKQQRRFRKPGR